MSDQALMEAKIEGSEGTAPQRTPLFNHMAAQLDAAMKGAPIPDKPATPDPAKAIAPPEPPKPPKPDEQSAPKPAEPPAPDNNKPSSDPSPEDDPNPFNRNWKVIHEQLKERKRLLAEFEKAKADREALAKQLEEAKAKPAATPPTPTPAPELEELRKTLEAEKQSKAKLEQELKILALERAPEFREHYQQRFDLAISQAQAAVPDDVKPKVNDLLNLPNTPYRKQLLTELMVDMNEFDKAALAASVMEMDRARAERDKALKDNQENYKRLQDLQAQKHAEEAKASAARQEMAIKGVIEAARQRFDAFKPVSGNDAHNAFVQKAEQRVARFFKGEATPEELSLLPVVASEYEIVTAQRDSLMNELEQAKKTIAAYESANPSISAGSKTADTKPKGFKEKFLDTWSGQR